MGLIERQNTFFIALSKPFFDAQQQYPINFGDRGLKYGRIIFRGKKNSCRIKKRQLLGNLKLYSHDVFFFGFHHVVYLR